jgi:uncharacterized coiled-coil protein SlyX
MNYEEQLKLLHDKLQKANTEFQRAFVEFDKARGESRVDAKLREAWDKRQKVYNEWRIAITERALIKVRAERDALRALLDALAEKLEALELGRTCTVCLERPAQIAAVPCGHRFVCTSEECRAKVDRHPNSRCYICREPMTGTLRVF